MLLMVSDGMLKKSELNHNRMADSKHIGRVAIVQQDMNQVS